MPKDSSRLPPLPPRIPKRFAGKSFATFDSRVDPSSVHALDAARAWVGGILSGEGPLLALVGPPGGGKSHLLYAALGDLWERSKGRREIFSRPWYRLADELRYGGSLPGWRIPDKEAPFVEAHEIRRGLYRAGVIAVDEVRVTAGTQFDDTELTKLACHAYDEGVPMILTSNVSPLAHVLGAAAADRFVEVVLNAPSGRARHG